MNLITRLLPPPRQWDDPLFRTDARSTRWGASWTLLRRRFWRWGLQMLVLVVIGVALLVCQQVLERSTYFYQSPYNPYYTFTNIMSSVLALVVFGSVAVNLLLDFVGVSAGLSTINSDFNQRRADLIRLTLLRPTEIVAAKHAVAQVRVLRMTFRIMWLRVWTVVLSILTLFWVWIESLTRGNTRLPDTLTTFSIIVIGGLTIATYVMEPYWRMKAITSVGVMQSARNLNGVNATLNAGMALIGFWIGQGAVLIGLVMLLQLLSMFYLTDQWYVFVALFACWALVTAAIYYFYAAITRNSLYQTAYRLASLDN
jgi:hypothetical protein